MLNNQKGFAQILALAGLFVLAASLGAGIYLVKQRTSAVPQASELTPPERNITGDFAAPPNVGFPIPFQVPDFIADLIAPSPTSQPTPKPTEIPPQPTPTTALSLTATPNPTLIPTFFPTPTLTITPTPTITTTPVPTTSLAPTSTPAPSLEGHYRVSFDSNFATLIDTGDGGVFGSGNEKTIDITLTSSSGQKYVYIQFYENGSWVPAVPVVASVNLVSAAGGNRDYGDGVVYGAMPPGGFWDDNGPSGPGWYLPTRSTASPAPRSSITVNFYTDTNLNGVRDGGERRHDIAAVQVRAEPGGGGGSGSTNVGTINFDLALGTYTVTLVDPTGRLTTPNPITVTIPPPKTVEFGIAPN